MYDYSGVSIDIRIWRTVTANQRRDQKNFILPLNNERLSTPATLQVGSPRPPPWRKPVYECVSSHIDLLFNLRLLSKALWRLLIDMAPCHIGRRNSRFSSCYWSPRGSWRCICMKRHSMTQMFYQNRKNKALLREREKKNLFRRLG